MANTYAENRAQEIEDAAGDPEKISRIIEHIAAEDPEGGGLDVLQALERRGLRG